MVCSTIRVDKIRDQRGKTFPGYKRKTRRPRPESPNREGWGSFIPADNGQSQRGSRIPQPGGWGSFIPAYNGQAARLPNPPTGRLGIVHSSLQRTSREAPESPNREVGDRSFQPTTDKASEAPESPNRRLGIVHSSLQRTSREAPESPNRKVGD